ncbi:hypothetical protein HPB52_015453 [Rhipicephalus sanguineus]|uniref:Uncharacterized protein n=1 Tax=Rhipicephalus sanguineus TaxID=34632 RepID=A0A9D4PQ45_RHISA|nr:hypothetical protein HPB52_015453 [Rhipicephalus sanguineus]
MTDSEPVYQTLSRSFHRQPQESKLESYERMWTVVSSNREDSLASSTAEGVERVQMGDYAFLMEAATIEYLSDRDCQLAQIGGSLDSNGYGFALPRGGRVNGERG